MIVVRVVECLNRVNRMLAVSCLHPSVGDERLCLTFLLPQKLKECSQK